MKKRYAKGSFTIEITLLMPLILTVIIILFFFVIYVYNRNVMQNAVCRGTNQVFYYMNEDNKKIQEECESVIMSDLDDCLVAVKDIELEVTVTALTVEAQLTGKLNVPGIIELKALSLDEMWNYNIQNRKLRIHSAELLRSGQQITGIYSDLTQEGAEDGSEL